LLDISLIFSQPTVDCDFSKSEGNIQAFVQMLNPFTFLPLTLDKCQAIFGSRL